MRNTRVSIDTAEEIVYWYNQVQGEMNGSLLPEQHPEVADLLSGVQINMLERLAKAGYEAVADMDGYIHLV